MSNDPPESGMEEDYVSERKYLDELLNRDNVDYFCGSDDQNVDPEKERIQELLNRSEVEEELMVGLIKKIS